MNDYVVPQLQWNEHEKSSTLSIQFDNLSRILILVFTVFRGHDLLKADY